MKTKLIVGFNERVVTEQELRNAQRTLLNSAMPANDRNLIDAVMSHVACGRTTVWTK